MSELTDWKAAPPRTVPEGTCSVTTVYRVPFFDTDAMGVVHHSNYLRYLELARVQYLQTYDDPYTRYVEQGVHVAVTGVEASFHRAARFDEILEISCWLVWIKRVSLRFDYVITCDGALVLSALTRHAAIDLNGRATRLPPQNRARLAALIASQPQEQTKSPWAGA